jgi:CRP-like cAMP-binding protein
MPTENEREGQAFSKLKAEARLLASKIVCLNLKGLSPTATRVIYQLPTREAFRPGEALQLPGPRSAILIEEGAVDIFPEDSYDVVPIKHLGPGYVFGDIPQLRMETFGARIIAAAASVIVFLNEDAFQTIIRKSPEIALRVIEMLRSRIPESEIDQVIKGFVLTDFMLLRLLRKLADENGGLTE